MQSWCRKAQLSVLRLTFAFIMDKRDNFKAIELLHSSSLSMMQIWQQCAADVPYHQFVLELRYRYCKSREDRELLRRRVCAILREQKK